MRLKEWSTRSAGVLQKMRETTGLRIHENIPYDVSGHSRRVLDIFVPESPSGNVVVIWHGGFFCRVEKMQNAFLAPPFLARDAVVVLGEYGLAPEFRVPEIPEHARLAHEWIFRNIARFGGDSHAVFAIGHSVGGLLVAEMMATDWRARGADLPPRLLMGGLAVSIVGDMRPIVSTSINLALRMEVDDAAAVSPVLKLNLSGAPLLYAVGEAESDGFKEQTAGMAAVTGWEGEVVTVPDADHLSVLDALQAETDSPLWTGMLRMMGMSARA